MHNKIKENKKILNVFVVVMSLFLLLSQLQFFKPMDRVRAEVTDEEGFDTPTYQSIHKGDMYSTGNVNLGIKATEAQKQTALYSDITYTYGTTPNSYTRELIDVDDDPTTTNSSKAYIPVPEDAEIEWAGLYWSSTRYELTQQQYVAPVKFTTPAGKSFQVSPSNTYYGSGLLYGFGIDGTYYSNYTDVTGLLKSSSAKGGSYTVANIPYPNTKLAYNSGYYSFAGWYMLVITKDKSKTRKAFTVYDGGLKRATGSGEKEFTMKNFIASKTGDLDPKVSVFAVQGDRYWQGDKLFVHTDNTWKEVTDKLNPTGNIFNSTISEYEEHMRDKYPGTFNPDYKNNLGVDADLIKLPAGYIKPNQKEIRLKAATSGDDYVLNTLAFAVNATAPELVIDKEVIDTKEKYDPGDEVTYRLRVKNIEPNSSSVDTKIEDVLDSRLEFVPDSVKIISGPNAGDQTEQVDYNAKTRKLTIRIGEGANATKGGIYTDKTPETTVEFKAKLRGEKVETEIPNIAVVQGIDELTGSQVEANDSNKVVVKVLPEREEKHGKLIATKLAKDINGGTLKVGDKLEYTIHTKNSVPDSLLKSVKITDKLPEGVEYVPNTLKINGKEQTDVEDEDHAHIKNGTIYAHFGDLKGEEEKAITFEIVVKPEMANKKVKNIAIVETDSSADKEKPEVETPVDPLSGQLESKKEIIDMRQEKVHVNDEFEYQIKVRNKVENGLIKDMRLMDKLPEGVEYVAGSMKVNGNLLTDAVDEDAGAYEDNTIKVNFGDVLDTEERMVTFKVKVTQDALKTKEIENIAVVEGKTPDNEDLPPQKPNVKTHVEAKEPKVSKMVSDADEIEVEKATLQSVGEEFTWHVNYNFGNDVMNLEKVVLQDDLEDILTILQVQLVNSDGEAIEVIPQIDEQLKNVSIELPKRDGNYNYLANQSYTMHIKSMLNANVNADIVTKYNANGGIPNKAELLFDQKKSVSNEVFVVPPTLGGFEIEKVDANDENLKLEGAVFEVISKGGNIVCKLTTDKDGLATSTPLIVGKYTLKEVQAPKGYMLMREPVEIEMKPGMNSQKIRVVNKKSEFVIPETGGTGTIIYYVMGGILMFVTLFLFVRKRNSER
ncbi:MULTISPECIES: isopeptide-forming domain-containing fimbrial protein [Bacillus cereus group]|uniref:LPXTG-domain-containing protein cell wall anchor domain n=1 Tax=Bacillus cereus VD048 TaxID=1053226 RepID=J8HSJ6_BACCE|nr:MULTISPECIES: isopeptide-forming domain-containing fimbrial protein [Bacillus cereus group]EJR30638.1 LPXTG-domain-containing protein cell wall anchor domain [Bacillus cereus VD048]WJE36440.1 isopeptide-forming domain-containing fimbrial protein [Bacillus mycoides]